MDGDLGQAYTQARSRLSPPDQATLRSEQLAWLRQRNECGTNVPCLDDAIRRRIAILQTLPREQTRVRLGATPQQEPRPPLAEGPASQRRTTTPTHSTVGGTSATPRTSATNPWGLPIRAGLPTLAIIQGTTPARPIAEAETQAWYRAIRALGISNAGQEPNEDTLVDLACIFMSTQEQVAASERSCVSLNISQLNEATTLGPTVRSGKEFILHDLAQAFKERFLPQLRNNALQIPFEFQIIVPASMSTPYDFSSQRQAVHVQDLRRSIFNTPVTYAPGTLFWPMRENEARAFGAQRNNGQFYIGLPLTIRGTNPSNYRDERYRSVWSRHSGLPLPLQWTIEVGTPTLYADVQLTRPLYRFTNSGDGQSTPAPVSSGLQIGQATPRASAASTAPNTPRVAASDSFESGRAAARIWGMPTRRNLPAIPPDFINNLASYYMLTGERNSRPDARPWALMFFSLTLAHMTQPIPEKGLVTAACSFLTDEQQRVLSGSTCREIGVMLGTVNRYQTGKEFAARDLANGFQQRHLNDVIGRAPALPMRIMFIVSARVGPYDMENERFTIVTHELGQAGKPSSYALWNSPLNFVVPEFYWPMPRVEARSYLRNRSSAGSDQPVFIGIEADLEGISNRGSNSIDANGVFPTYIWQISPRSLSLYRDAQLTNKLHDFPEPR